MKRYSIMSADVEHVDEICADIIDQYKRGIAELVLFSFPLVPEGTPPADKARAYGEKYELFRDRLRREGYDCGMLIQASIGHGYNLNQPFPFQRYTNLTDGRQIDTCCPYDTDFQDYLRTQMASLASHRPALVMVDDDLRLMFRDGKGCACPLHLQALKKRLGRELSREELLEKLQDHDEKVTEAFADTQREALEQAAHAIREGLDSVDPTIPGAFCCCGPNAEFACELAPILAGKGNPTVVRLNNGNYTASGMRQLSYAASQRAAMSMAIMKGKIDCVLAETDTCPQNRYSTSAATLHAHFTASIAEGADGAKHWISRMASFEPASGRAYRDKLAEYSGFYQTLSDTVKTTRWFGLRIPMPPKPVYKWETMGFYGDVNTWGYKVLERLGLPLYFSSEPGGVTFLENDADARFTDEEIAGMLSGWCFLSSRACAHLEQRGFGRDLGVSARPWHGPVPSLEKTESGVKLNKQFDCRELAMTDLRTHADSFVYHRDGDGTETLLFPGITRFENDRGGTVLVAAGTSDTQFNFLEAFGFLTEARKRQLIRLLAPSGELKIYYPGDAEIFLKGGLLPDGKKLCVLFNLGFDELETVPLCVDAPVVSVERLTKDGTWEQCAFASADGQTVISSLVRAVEPAVFRLG